MKRKWILCAVMLLQFIPVGIAQNLEKIDSLLQRKYESNTPGASILIAKKNQIIYNQSFGLSNLELKTTNSSKTVFEIGSMTKQFTAVSILILVEQGLISLDDEISKYIEGGDNLNGITIQHLLTHTSGIKNYTSMRSIQSIAFTYTSPKDLIDFFIDSPRDFEPGEKFQYNNSGYVILGYIIEKVSGKTYGEFVQENIFDIAQMEDSYYADRTLVIDKRANGYHLKQTYINNRKVDPSIFYSAGAILSTTEDLLKWQIALLNNSIIDRKTIDLAWSNYATTDGEKINYGFGWHIETIADKKTYEHGGSVFGFKSMAVYIPQEDIYVVNLSNCDCNSPTQITREIAKLSLENM